jgi:hypothetical protein
VVEAAIKYITRSWWTSAPVASLGQAQADLDRWAIAVSDQRKRAGGTIAELAAQEQLLPLPGSAFPALLQCERVVSRTAMVSFEGNRYSVPPGFVGRRARVSADARRGGEPPLPVISRRYEHGSIILTTNRGIAEWGEIFEDSTVAVAILDRLLHHATVLQIDGESYRMRGYRAKIAQLRAGLNRTSEGGEF